MKSIAAIAVIGFATMSFAHPQTERGGRTSLKETLINLEKQSWEAWKKRDGKFFQGFLSEDHVEVGFSGTASKQQVVPFVASRACVVNGYAVDKFSLVTFDAKTAC